MKKIFLICLSLFLTANIFAQTKYITFATDATYPPFEFMNQNGQMQGFDVDIIKAMCAVINANCTFQNQAWDSLIPSLQLGKFDAMFGAMNITPEREKQVDFTNPYYANTASIVALKSANLNLTRESLQSKTIGALSGSTFPQYLHTRYGTDVRVTTYASEETAFFDLTSGRIDAVMGDTPLIQTWLKKNNNATKYAIVGAPIDDPNFFGKGYGIAVKKGNTALIETLNAALAAIKNNGAYDKIVQQYFGIPKP